MAIRIVFNDQEVTNPFIKTLLMLGAIIIAAVVTAVVIFILFPIIGIAVTLSLGFIGVFIIATLISVVTLALVTVISAWLFGSTELRIERFHKRK
ncbi:MAG: hypothetical protein ACN4GM_14060 [Gammaproteobacteria bacterium]